MLMAELRTRILSFSPNSKNENVCIPSPNTLVEFMSFKLNLTLAKIAEVNPIKTA